MRTAVAFDSRVREHHTGPEHPEQVARFDAILSRLEQAGLLAQTTRPQQRVATDEELALVHTDSYIALVAREVAQGRRVLSTGDTDINPGSAEAARVAVGCALAAADAIASGQVDNAFCIVRPPGHHAGANYGMGFCLFNTVAVAARYVQRVHGAGKVAIVDWDVHHGNGTQDVFYSDGSVLFFSTHQSPLYPGTGAAHEIGFGEAAGTTINHPLPAGSGRAEIGRAFETSLAPALAAFRPDWVLISAGFDSRMGDPLGRFTLTDRDFAELTIFIRELAAKYGQGHVLSVLEGGYHLEGLASAAEAHVRALRGEI